MYATNFVVSNDGNISVKVSDNTIRCTPTGVSKGYLTTARADRLIEAVIL